MTQSRDLLLEAAPKAWRRLYERYGIVPGGQSGLVYISSVVQPVVDLDRLLKALGAQQYDSSGFNPGFSGLSLEGYTVPAGQRFEIMSISIYQKTGDNTFSSIELRDASTTRESTVAEFSAASSHTFIPGQIIELDELDAVWWTLDGAGSGVSSWRQELWGYLLDIA